MSDKIKATDEELQEVGLLESASTDSNPTVDSTVDLYIQHGEILCCFNNDELN